MAKTYEELVAENAKLRADNKELLERLRRILTIAKRQGEQLALATAKADRFRNEFGSLARGEGRYHA